MEKILGFRNLQEKLEKILGGNIAAFYVIFQENKDFATIKSSSFSIALCIDFRYRTLFPYKPDLIPNFFRHTLMSRIRNLGLFKGYSEIISVFDSVKRNEPRVLLPYVICIEVVAFSHTN